MTTQELIALAVERGEEGCDKEQFTRECAMDIYGELRRGELEGDAEAFADEAWREFGCEVRFGYAE